MFTRKANKKHKSFEDGVLILSLKNLLLQNSESKKVIEKPNLHKARAFRIGQNITLGIYEVEITKQIEFEEYTSGRCFFNNSSSTQHLHKLQTIKRDEPRELVIPADAFVLDFDKRVYVEPFLAAHLRPHQKEGVQFMYDCITGKRAENHFGCILADSMGLGKTLQSITLLYTLLRKDCPYEKISTKGIIVAPSSLLNN